MGWAVDDKPVVEQAKIDLSMTRSARYSLLAGLLLIKHQEKREVLVALAGKLVPLLDAIEFHLNR